MCRLGGAITYPPVARISISGPTLSTLFLNLSPSGAWKNTCSPPPPVSDRQVAGSAPCSHSSVARVSEPPLRVSTSTTMRSSVASPTFASGSARHHASTTWRTLLALKTPFGENRATGCFAGLAQDGRPQVQVSGPDGDNFAECIETRVAHVHKREREIAVRNAHWPCSRATQIVRVL